MSVAMTVLLGEADKHQSVRMGVGHNINTLLRRPTKKASVPRLGALPVGMGVWGFARGGAGCLSRVCVCVCVGSRSAPDAADIAGWEGNVFSSGRALCCVSASLAVG